MKNQPETLTPRLRFPEFKSGPGWARATLSFILTDHGLTSDGTSEVHSVSLTSGVVPQIEHMGRSFAATKTDHYRLVRPFDIVYTRSPLAVFKLGIVKQHKGNKNAIVSPLYGVFTPKDKDFGLLIEAYFDNPYRSIRYLDPLAQKGAKNTIQLSNERFLSGLLYFPEDKEEQTAVAACLTSLDELLAAEGRRLEALWAYKKGLMKQLFPRAGESRPRLRFPEFRGAGDWSETTIAGMGEVITGNTPATTRREYYGGAHLFVSPGDISDLRLVETTKITLSESGFCQAREVKAWSVLFVCIGSTIGKVAQCTRPCATNQQINAVVAKAVFDQDFTYYRLLADSERIAKLAGKQAVPIINKTLFSSVKVTAPEIAEQQQIAACLSSLDALIAAASRRLDKLRAHKKALMQQLFPSLEGV